MRYFIFFLLGIFSSSLFAGVKVDVYHTQVTLQEGQSEHDAQVAGLANVIIKASGNVSAGNNIVVKKAFSNVSYYLTEVGHDKNSDNQTVVKLGFNSKHIRELLTQAQLPYWPDNRTNILIWYIKDNGQQRSVSWENTGSDEIAWIKLGSDLRGLPLTIPVGDFNDIMNVEVSDLWGGFLKPISQASRRYRPDAVLVVRAQNNRTRWTLYDQSPDDIAKDSASPMTGSVALSGQAAIHAVVDDVAQYYARKNGVLISAKTSKSSVAVKINNLKNAIDFFSMENELKSMSSVASLEVTKVAGESVLYTIHILTSEENFKVELSKSRHLSKIEEPVTDVTSTALVNTVNAPDSAVTNPGPENNPTEATVPTATTSGVSTGVTDHQLYQPDILQYEWH